jgi:acetyltransferase
MNDPQLNVMWRSVGPAASPNCRAIIQKNKDNNAIFTGSILLTSPAIVAAQERSATMTIDLNAWERHIILPDGSGIFVRPIKPDDQQLYAKFFELETPDDIRFRFFGPVKRRDPAFFSRFTNIDYATAMAFIALDESSGDMLGVARLHDDASDGSGEYAIVVRSDHKSHGLGWHLMQILIEYGRAKKLRAIKGQVLYENKAMLHMCRDFGFSISPAPNAADVCNVELKLI